MKKMLLIIMGCILITACKNKAGKPETDPGVYYTCSMDPQVKENAPGKCPICKMELTRVAKGNHPDSREIRLSGQQVQLGNIQLDTLQSGASGDQMILTATLNFDRNKETVVSARIKGRVDKLYFKNTGDRVQKGDLLFDLYSEELYNALQEYLLDNEKQKTLGNALVDFKQIIAAAKNKLLLWGMTEKQIEVLLTKGKASPITGFYSPVTGSITSLLLKEGEYVSEGGTVLTLADLSTVWVEAQVFASQLASLDQGGNVSVEFPDAPGKQVSGRIEFVNPEINADTRINLVRITAPNFSGQLKPGMPAYVFIKNGQHHSVSLPIDAVLRDAKGAMVWVQKAKNTFAYKMVTVGAENNGRIEILSGLQKNDAVVVSGAYLINSEYIFKNGSNPMAGMKM